MKLFYRMTDEYDWSKPLNLLHLRLYLTAKEPVASYIQFSAPARLNVIGLVSGYRELQTDPDFREFFLDVTQGYDEELRINYQGILTQRVS